MSAGKATKALRRFCLECQGGSAPSVFACADTACVLYTFRQCTTVPLPEGARPLRGIRQHCLLCAGSRQDVRACDAKETCSLWSYRFGVLPGTFKRVALRRKKKRETLFLPGFGPVAG